MAMQDFDVNEELLEQERERMIEASLEIVRQQNEKYQRLKTGKCLNCQEKLPDPSASFCDKYCKEDYDRRLYADSQRVR